MVSSSVSMKNVLLKAENVSFSFSEGNKVLHAVSFGVKKGEALGIAGRTGSGKTTLLKCCYGLFDIEEGAISFDGEKVRGPSLELIPGHPKMKLIAQQPQLEEQISIAENVLRKLLFYQKDFRAEKAQSLMEITGLDGMKDRLPRELSGGQRQLLGIACALAEEPDILLLDEPFSNLDQVTKESTLAIIQELKAQLGFALIFVSHDSSDLLGIVDHIIVLKEGRVVEEGSPEKLFNKPGNAYTAELLGPVNWLTSAMADSLGNSDWKHKGIRPWHFIWSEKEGIPVKVISSSFHGNYYSVWTKTKSGKRLRIDLKKALKPGKTGFLRLRKENLLLNVK